MFPYLRLGPFLIQMPLLALLVGLWGSMSLVKREAKRLEMDPSRVGNLITYSLLAGLVGARLGYALRFPSLYASKPLSLLALTPTTLLPSMGLLVGAITFWILIDRQNLKLRPTLDTLAPGLALFLVFVGLAHILSGDAYGAPANVPWALRLWNDYRHPTQFYELLIALTVFTVVYGRYPKPEGAGLNFLLVVVLSSASRLFLEAFRGDSVFLPGGFREAQLIALAVMGVGYYWMRKWMNLETI
ncbi:MAG TPA: prolipoprotein diacylglyceryl transferase family protein [Anaerolineales bacterium]|nr:prolipoprotein diacylglyceryl transferase family protein [Anaerolineales bacterium]